VIWHQQELQKEVELSVIISRILLGRSRDRTGWKHLIPIRRTMQDSCDWENCGSVPTDVHPNQAVYICSECRQSTLRGRTRINTRLGVRTLENIETNRGLMTDRLHGVGEYTTDKSDRKTWQTVAGRNRRRKLWQQAIVLCANVCNVIIGILYRGVYRLFYGVESRMFCRCNWHGSWINTWR
jgi:hypothetical protein